MTARAFNKCLTLLRNGNRQGLEKIFKAYHKRAYNAAFAKTGNGKAAEFVVSAFLNGLASTAEAIKNVSRPNEWVNRVINLMAENLKNDDRLNDFTKFDK